MYVLKQKSDVLAPFKKWKTLIEEQTIKKVNRLMIDNNMKFCLGNFDESCKNERISRHGIAIGIPQQNRVAEHMNETLL